MPPLGPPPPPSSEYSPLYAIAAVAAMLPPQPLQQRSAELTELTEQHHHHTGAGNGSVAGQLAQSIHAYQAALVAAAGRARDAELESSGLRRPASHQQAENCGGPVKGDIEQNKASWPSKCHT
jgi:hypothetical protein